MSFKQILILLFSFVPLLLSAQDYAIGLQVNEAVQKEISKVYTDIENLQRSVSDNETSVVLPFFDDFSTSKIFPDQNLWQGYSVFVNNDFAYMPVNIGAATLDAIDSTGRVYKDASWVPSLADKLLSKNIRLDSIFDPPRQLSPSDSIYLSFFYQPQGVGDAPAVDDSLVLEFSHETGNLVFSHMDSVFVNADIYMQSPNDTIWPLDTLWAPSGCNPEVFTINYKIILWGDIIQVACDSVFVPEVLWNRVWYAEGQTLSDFYDTVGSNMKQVLIPITDSMYFNDKFRFRFRNYVSISNDNYPPSWKSNTDQWNIDYVYLNYNRSIKDTTYRALTFSQRAPSFLKNFEVMPYRQYRYSPTSNTRPDFNMFISNLDSIEHNTKYSYHVTQVNGNFSYNYFGGSCNLLPFYVDGFQQCEGCGTAHACPPVTSLFSLDYDRDTTSYIIKHYISDSSDQNSIVDSAIYVQGFYNYYAYDDGTPEKGWGVDGAGGSQIAYQFSLNMADTLQGLQIYFNRALNDANEFYFDILVWSDNNGKPGEEIYRIESQQVKWENGLYSFYPYIFDEPVKVTGTIYVGFEKLQKDNMNIGMDANNNHRDKIFYKSDVEWNTATVDGALLIRPIIGSDLILSMDNIQSNIINKLKIYPNPAVTSFSISNINIENDPMAELIIFNIYGQVVLNQKGLLNDINISQFEPGIYVVKVVSNNTHYSTKLLINR